MDSTLPTPDPHNEELEMKIQELFTANRKIEILQANTEYLEQENESLKRTVEEGTKLLEDAKRNEGKAKNDDVRQQLIADLRQELEEYQNIEKTLKEENVRLEKRLQQVLENPVANISSKLSTSQSDLEIEEILSLTAQVTQLGEDKAKLQAELLAMSEALQQKTDEKTSLQHEMLEKDEELECMESQFSTQCDINERLREEIEQLKMQLESSEEGQVNDMRKGNSLFSEVDDRRVAAETKVVQIHEKMKSLEEVVTREQKENKRLKTQITYLRHSSKKGFDEDSVKGLQTQLVQAKKTIADLTEKMAKLEFSQTQNPIPEHFKPGPAGGADDDKRYINFLEGIIRTKTKEISEVRLQAHASHQQSVRTDLHLTQANNELHILRHEITQLKQRNSHLSMMVQDLKHKYAESSPGICSPDQRSNGRRVSSNGCNSSTPTTKTKTACPPSLGGNSDVKENICPSSSSTKSSRHKSPEPSQNSGTQNVRLRDLINLENTAKLSRSRRGEDTGKSTTGVQLSQEVKVVSSDGNESTATLRDEGTSGKLRRTKGTGTGKYVSINYEEVSTESPAECKQQ